MVKIFLSHSSLDKKSVLRLAKDLRSRNISVWLDEWEIEVGDSIPEKIQEGLVGAGFVAVWLTPNSVKSGWVTKEWQTKIYQEISSKDVMVLPLLAVECEMPIFLSDKKFADFRFSYQEGFKALLSKLTRQRGKVVQLAPEDASFSITHYTSGFLRDLEDAHIPLPTLGNLKLVKALKTLPRSGKLLRLEDMNPPIPIRSIFDHIMSVAHSADCLLSEIDPGILGRDRIDLARVIAYHDLCEVILGDIPQYTRLNRSTRNRARVSAEIRLSQLPHGEPERITNEFIGMFLQENQRNSLNTAVEILSGDSIIRSFFYALDKLDPILAVWRYIHHLRDNSEICILDLLSRLQHFFDNPKVRIAVAKNIKDVRLLELTDQLQNPVNAKQYFEQQSIFCDVLFALPESTIRKLIEGRPLEFTEVNLLRKRPSYKRVSASITPKNVQLAPRPA